jgi:hypothetical protein
MQSSLVIHVCSIPSPPPRIVPCMLQIVRRRPAPRSLLHGIRVPTVVPVVLEQPTVETIVGAHAVRVVALGALVVECETVGATVAGEGDGAGWGIFVFFFLVIHCLFWIFSGVGLLDLKLE